jgi:hypothetical protein
MTLHQFLDSSAIAAAVERLGWVLVHSLWQFAAVAAVVATALWLARRSAPAVRHGLLLGGLVAFVALPVATWCLVDLSPAAALANAAELAALPVGERGLGPAADRVTASGPIVPPGHAHAGRVPKGESDQVTAIVAGSFPLRKTLRPWLGWCVAAWLVGVMACAARPLVGWLAWRRLVAAGVAVPAHVAALVERAGRRLGLSRPVKVLASAACTVPAVAGWLAPVMLVPVALLTSLPPVQLETILLHELAHVRRGDFLVHMLQVLVETLGFYHPAVWWLSGRLRVEREHCCDDLVVATAGGREAYGRALVAVEELRGTAAAVALSAADGSLLARIRRLVTGVEPRASGWPLPAFAAAGLAGLLVAVSLAAPARADELPKDTNQIKSLTPEQARKLVEHALTEQIIQRYPDERSRAMVVNHKETVEILESWARLRLNGLTTLDAETAKALALFKGTLELDGLPALTPEAARELVKGHCKFVRIDGLKTLSPDTAQEFVKLRLVAHGIFCLTSAPLMWRRRGHSRRSQAKK